MHYLQQCMVVEVKIKHGARDVLNSDKAVVSIIKVELVDFFF